MTRVEQHIFSLNFYSRLLFFVCIFLLSVLCYSLVGNVVLSLWDGECDLNLRDINYHESSKISSVSLPKKAKVINEYNIKSFNKSFHCDTTKSEHFMQH